MRDFLRGCFAILLSDISIIAHNPAKVKGKRQKSRENDKKRGDLMEKLYTCEDVAERYAVSTYTVREWIKAGRLTGYKISGKSYRIPESALLAFEKANAAAVKKEGV